jgi:hypothetical protein
MRFGSAFFVPALIGLVCTSGQLCAAEKFKLLGTWEIEASSLTMPNAPQHVTITFSDVGANQYKMSVDIVDHEGKPSHGEGVFTPNGDLFPASGSLDVDIVSMTMPSAKILVMGAGIAGQPSSTRVFSLSDDGKHMIETVVRHGDKGHPITRVDIWDMRKRPAT